MKCLNCAQEIDLPEKIGFREECPHCGTDIHACIFCSFYDVSVYNECREPSADRVLDKEKANYCEYYILNIQNQSSKDRSSSVDAKKKLEELFKK